MRVRITHRLSGSVDGINLSKFLQGLTYDVGTTLANYLLAQGWAAPAAAEVSAAGSAVDRSIRRPGVLIVEDDEDMRAILTQLLEFHGWEAFAACDGKEGLEALQRHRPSLVLLDLAMPRMNGAEFRRAQQRLPDKRLANVPVVVVSAVHDAPAYKSSLNAAEVLVKPFEAERLLQAVESHMRPANLLRT